MELQQLYDKVFQKAQKFGELSSADISCQEAMEIIRLAQAAQQSAQAAGAKVCPECGSDVVVCMMGHYCGEKIPRR